MTLSASLEEHIVHHHLGGEAADLTPDTPLLQLNIVDSVGILDIVQFLVDEFDVAIPLSEVKPQNFESIRTIVNMVESLGGAQA